MKQLLPHQIEDSVFLSATPGVKGNFSGMGSGKTVTALEGVRLIRAQTVAGAKGAAPDFLQDMPAIIVGPPISLHMWAEEFEEHIEGSVVQIVRTGKEKLKPADAYVMSYDIATKRKEELKALRFQILICDESHALKNIKAKRTKAILGRHGLCETAIWTWCLTGTPSVRWNDDLFSFICRADNAALTEKIGKVDMARFQLRYCITQKKTFSKFQKFPTVVTVGNRNTHELNEMIFDGGMAVRRELRDVFENMPPLTINRLQVSLDADADLKKSLRSLEKQTMADIQQDMANNEEHLATIRRKLGVAKVKHSVSEIVDRVEAGIKPILVSAVHHDVIDALHEGLFAKGVTQLGVIDGRTKGDVRQSYVEGFNKGTLDVVIGQVNAMGVSLNMQGGSHIVVVEEDWSPAVQAQLYARCHRLGQKDHVHVDIFESDTKLDKAVRRISAAKSRGHNTLMEQSSE